MSKRPHVKYDKTDGEIEDMVSNQMGASGSNPKRLPTTDDLQNIEAEVKRILQVYRGWVRDADAKKELPNAVAQIAQLCSSRELVAAIKELEWVLHGDWTVDFVLPPEEMSMSARHKLLVKTIIKPIEERLAALKKKEK